MNAASRLTVGWATALALATAPAGAGETYVVDKSHSEATFKVRHLVSKVSGRFTGFDGEILIDRDEPARSHVSFTIDAGSIDTSHAPRDEHLRSADFFDVAQHPRITFVSDRVERLAEGRFAVSGTLTIAGVARRVTLPVDFLGFVTDPWGNDKAGFAIRTTLNRKDYGIVWNKALDSGGLILGDEVQIEINLEVAKQKA